MKSNQLHKTCSKCGCTFPISGFYPSPKGKHGVGSVCRACESTRHKQSYLKTTGKTCVAVHKHTIDKCHEHAAKHGGLCLSTKYVDSDTKYQWRCPCGHEWSASLPTTQDRWCPKCAVAMRATTKLTKYGNAQFNNPSKSKTTCLERYGAACSMGNRDVALKNARARNNSYIMRHWLTDEELVCQGKWERNVVQWLNTNRIDFNWQIPFALSNGKTYFIDFYDKARNIYVEIKGWWRDDAREKFDMFKSNYPDLQTEVWDKEQLLKRTIDVR